MAHTAAHAHAHGLLHDHAALVEGTAGIVARLLVIVSVVALGAAGTDLAVRAIAVLAPLALLGVLAVERADRPAA